jgi:lactoylglutathione lyase
MKQSIILFSFLICIATANAQKQKAQINHTAILVTNLQQSTFFYQNIIGLDTITEPFHDGKHKWLKTGTGVALHLIEGAKEKKVYFWEHHTCFSVVNFQQFLNDLKNNNISWQDSKGEKNKITTRPDSVHQIWLQDPDGYWIEINDDKF